MNWLYHRGNVRIRPAIYSDVERMHKSLRESDRLEILASHNHTPYEALRYGIEHSSICLTVLFKDDPVAIGGVVPDKNVKQAAVVWLLGTNDVYQMRLSFLKLSKVYIRLLQQLYPILYNFIDPRNIATIRWLSWLGATLDDPQPIGVNKAMFQYFSIEKWEMANV